MLGAAGPKAWPCMPRLPRRRRRARPAPHPGRHRFSSSGASGSAGSVLIARRQPVRACGFRPVSARGRLLRQWRGRKRRNVGFRSGRDEFVKDPLLKSGAYSSKGSARVFRGRVPPAPGRAPIQAERLPVLQKGHRAARTPRNGCKTHPPGKWHARYRKSTPVPALGPRCRSPALPASPILGHFSPARRRVDQGVIRLPAGDGVRSRPAHAASLAGALGAALPGMPRACRSATNQGPPRRR